MRPLCAVLASAVALGPLIGPASALAQTVPFAQSGAQSGAQSQVRAEAVSDGPEQVAVVVYRDQPVRASELIEQGRNGLHRMDRQGLAMIVERRTFDVPAGEGVIRFKGLATGIVPHSAVLEGLPGDIVEQNADYDLITPRNLLAQSVGQTVSVVRTNPGDGAVEEVEGIVRAGRDGTVIEMADGIEALNCSGLVERIVFHQPPEGLGATPTLSVRTRAARAGRHEVTLAYLATGLQWSADYVARVRDDAAVIDLEGWITLANFGGTGFVDAPVVVVAGDLARDGDTVPVTPRTSQGRNDCWPSQTTDDQPVLAVHYEAAQGPMLPMPSPPTGMMRAVADEIVVTGNRVKAQLQELGDYKAYVIPHRTTVAAQQTKQVLFLAQEGIRAERVRVIPFIPRRADVAPAAAALELRVRNDEAHGLGVPVPEGVVTYYAGGTAGQPLMYVDEQSLKDTAVGLPLRFRVGEDPGVTARIVETADGRQGSGARRRHVSSYRVELANATQAAVDIELPMEVGEGNAPDFRIDHEGVRSRIDRDTGLRVWRLSLGAGQQRTYEVRWSFSDPE